MHAEPIRAACHAMGTRFEAVIWGGPEERLHAAAHEAFGEIERLHAQLSAFDPASDIWDINARAAREPVLVEPRLFALLERCLRLTARTHGAFDITVGRLMEAWGFRDTPTYPSHRSDPSDQPVGPDRVILDREGCTVRFATPDLSLDLGGIAKGYALDAAADILRECGIEGALIHGGTSSVLGLGTDPSGHPWRVGIRRPGAPEGADIIATATLRDCALAVSAPHGRTVTVRHPLPLTGEGSGREAAALGHVMDPRTRQPAEGIGLAAVACASATDADAFSTALLVLGQPFADELRSLGCDVWLMGSERPWDRSV